MLASHSSSGGTSASWAVLSRGEAAFKMIVTPKIETTTRRYTLPWHGAGHQEMAEIDIYKVLFGCLGAALVEVLHWNRIARRGRYPRYSKSKIYWITTALLIALGGVLTAVVSPIGSSPLHLVLLGTAGPQLLHTAAQTQTLAPKKSEPTLGVTSNQIVEFLGS